MADLKLFTGKNYVKFWGMILTASQLADVISSYGGDWTAINYGSMGWISIFGGMGTDFSIPEGAEIEIHMNNTVTITLPQVNRVEWRGPAPTFIPSPGVQVANIETAQAGTIYISAASATPSTASAGETVNVFMQITNWDIDHQTLMKIIREDTGDPILSTTVMLPYGYEIDRSASFIMPSNDVPLRFECRPWHDLEGYYLADSTEVTVTLATQAAETDTSLTLFVDKTTAAEGELVSATGHLSRNDTGAGVANAAIFLYDRDPGFDDYLDASGYTDVNGNYSIGWAAEKRDPFQSTIDMISHYQGGDVGVTILKPTTSNVKIITIVTDPVQINAALTLSANKTTAVVGEEVVFTGRLTRTDTGAGVAGQEILVGDQDFWTANDIIGTPLTNEGGYYIVSWLAERLDVLRSTVNIAAVFEGATV